MLGIEVAIVVIALIVLFLGVRTVRIVPQARVGIIQRLGNYRRTADAGVAIVWPFIDRMLPLLDMREQVVSFPPQPVITSDNVTINVTSVVYYQILHPKNATYQVANLLAAMEQLTQTTLRNVMDEVTEKWGVRVNRVELKDIAPPKDIQIAMEKQMQAERQKRAAILTAEGEAQSAILRAEGNKKATMLPKLAENPANKVLVVPTDYAGLAGLATTLGNLGANAAGAPANGRRADRS